MPAAVIIVLCGIAGGLIAERFFDASRFKPWIAVLRADPQISGLTGGQHAAAILAKPNVDAAIALMKAQGVPVDAEWMAKHVTATSRRDGSILIRCRDTWLVEGRWPVQTLSRSYAKSSGLSIDVPTMREPQHIVIDFVSVPTGVACGGLAGGLWLLARRVHARRVASGIE